MKYKFNKTQRAEIENILKERAKERGFKAINNYFYEKIGDAFIYCCFGITPLTGKCDRYIFVKNYDWDDIFWKIMDMEKNSKSPFHGA